MKAVTIYEPYASFIAAGIKRFETRSWEPSYRGPIAIHASRKKLSASALDAWRLKLKELDYSYELPENYEFTPQYGMVLAIMELEEVIPTDFLNRDGYLKWERLLGNFNPGRFAWRFNYRKPITPVAAKGYQRLWEWQQ